MVDLKSLVEPVTRGDPMQPLLWTTRSLRNLVKELAKKGHTACPTVVGDLLRRHGLSPASQPQDAGREFGIIYFAAASSSTSTRRWSRSINNGAAGNLGGHEKEGIGRRFQEWWLRMAAQGHAGGRRP